MNSFLIAFVSSIAAGVVATFVMGLFNKHFQLPPKSFASDPIAQFPYPMALRIAAFFAFLMTPAFLLLVVSMVATVTHVWRNDQFVFGSFGLFVGFEAAFFSFAFVLRCPKCRKHVLLQWVSAPTHGEKNINIDSGASAAHQVMWKQRFHCMYCGQQFQVGTPPQ